MNKMESREGGLLQEELTNWLLNASPEDICTGSIVWDEQVIFRNVYVCTYTLILICMQLKLMLKEATNLKDIKEEYVGGLGGREIKRRNSVYIIIRQKEQRKEHTPGCLE